MHILLTLHNFYRLTRDWMYAFRWVPARFFRNQLKQNPFTSRQEAVYLAHKELSPNLNDFKSFGKSLGPTSYREKYIEMLMQAPNDGRLHDPIKYQKRDPQASRRSSGLMKKVKGMLDMPNIQYDYSKH